MDVVTKPRKPGINEILTPVTVLPIGAGLPMGEPHTTFRVAARHIRSGLTVPVKDSVNAWVGWFTQASKQIPFEPWLVFSMTVGSDSEHGLAVSHYLPVSGEAGWHWHVHWLKSTAFVQVEVNAKGWLKSITAYMSRVLIGQTVELLGEEWLQAVLSFPPFEEAIVRFHGPNTIQLWVRLRPGTVKDKDLAHGGLAQVSQGAQGGEPPLPSVQGADHVA